MIWFSVRALRTDRCTEVRSAFFGYLLCASANNTRRIILAPLIYNAVEIYRLIRNTSASRKSVLSILTLMALRTFTIVLVQAELDVVSHIVSL